MATVDDAEDAKNKRRMILISIAAAVAIAGAVWSGFRALDNRPRVTGTLGDAPPPRSSPAQTNDTPAGKRGE